MSADIRHISVSLRSGTTALLLQDHPVLFADEKPEPIEHAGQRYVFTHVVEGGYSGSEPTVYVFSAA